VDFDDRVTDLIADGYDLAIRGGHIVDSSLVSRPVCQLKTVLVASPGYLERCGVPTTPDDLAHHHLIARRFLSGRVFLGVQGTGRQPDDAGTRRSGCDPLRTRSSNAGCAFRIRIAQVGVHHALVHLQSGALKPCWLASTIPGITRWLSSILTVRWSRHA
jgi:DNA-binding transcriptional LysR family regulator